MLHCVMTPVDAHDDGAAGAADAHNLAAEPPRWSLDERRALARQVRPARLTRRISQQDLALMAGVTRNTVAGLENGTKVPQARPLWLVLGALGIRPDMAPRWDVETETWFRVMAPLVRAVPQPRRGVVMLEVIERLSAELRHASEPPASSS